MLDVYLTTQAREQRNTRATCWTTLRTAAPHPSTCSVHSLVHEAGLHVVNGRSCERANGASEHGADRMQRQPLAHPAPVEYSVLERVVAAQLRGRQYGGPLHVGDSSFPQAPNTFKLRDHLESLQCALVLVL